MYKSRLRMGFIVSGQIHPQMFGDIVHAGNDVVVCDLTGEIAREFTEMGAVVAVNLVDLCKDRDVVTTMLDDDSAVRKAVTDPRGICDSMPAGSIHLAMGTCGVATIRLIEAAHREANQILVAAPILGGLDLFATPEVIVAAAGPTDALRRVDPLLKAMRCRIFPAGTNPEAATITKLADRFVMGCALQAMAEAFSLVRKYGVDPQVFYDTLIDSNVVMKKRRDDLFAED